MLYKYFGEVPRVHGSKTLLARLCVETAKRVLEVLKEVEERLG